jgi:2-(1,2-epoxy-1,2-dihydrophenyl)acetyl-CoA isomerase
MNTILLKIENQIATITFNRPQVFNSFNSGMRQEMMDALDSCADASVRCVIITGEGKAFCAGQDLAEISNPVTAPSFDDILTKGFNQIVLKIKTLEKPVIASVNGVAAGAGANLALACDFVLAAESAHFIQAFSKIGLIPDSGGTYTLPRLIGYARASALMMLGEKVSAREAENMGMIYRCYPDNELPEKVQQMAAAIAQMPTRGLALTKQALNQSFANTFENQLLIETNLQSQAGNSADYAEGVAAFLEKRKPVFKGK